MPARVPILRKTPFAIDPEPLRGACSARAGLAGVSRVYRSLGLPGSCEANLRGIKSRQRGLEEGQTIESSVLLHAAGGECMDDMDRLREDEGLARIPGYQPLVATWAETGLVLADEFRDGNVPGDMAPLTCARTAFAALPQTVTHYAFRGDTACYEGRLLAWLDDPRRADGPQGRLEFAVGAPCHDGLVRSLRSRHH